MPKHARHHLILIAHCWADVPRQDFTQQRQQTTQKGEKDNIEDKTRIASICKRPEIEKKFLANCITNNERKNDEKWRLVQVLLALPLEEPQILLLLLPFYSKMTILHKPIHMYIRVMKLSASWRGCKFFLVRLLLLLFCVWLCGWMGYYSMQKTTNNKPRFVFWSFFICFLLL